MNAISVVISIIESYFTFISDFIPGLKLGLSNIVIIYVLYKYGFKTSIMVSLIRVLIVALLRTGFGINFFFSLSGALFSIIAMVLVKKTIVGSIFHSIGQVLVGILVLNNYNITYYLPYLLIFSIPTGIIVGIVSKKLIDNTKNIGRN